MPDGAKTRMAARTAEAPQDGLSERIASVLICGDIIATRESEQASNLRWVADLLARPLRQALGDHDAVRVGLGQGAFDRARFFAAAGQDADLAARHTWFDAGALPAEALALLRQAIGARTLVIGYELSGMTRMALGRAGIPVIDIWLHPVRFADDILFAMRASDPALQARIEGFAVAEESLAAQADLLRIQNYRGFARFEKRLVEGAALFVGQTPRDKAVMDRGRFLTLIDFADDFASLTREAPHVYYARHPFVHRTDPETDRFLKGFLNVTELAAPTYHLLADPRIATVAALSSSVLEEARYFGKQVRCLFRPPIPLAGPERYATIFQSLCFSHFWAQVLGDEAAVADCPPAAFLDPRSKLRHVLSFYWGYPQIDRYEHALAGPSAAPAAEDTAPAVDIETAGIVSFDIFDTLLVRRDATPRDVFRTIAPLIAARLGEAPDGFADRRVLAEKAATRRAARQGREDPTLAEIYAGIARRAPDDPLVAELAGVEIAADAEGMAPRPAGQALYRAARAAGRRIVLISDMYLPRDAVEAMLRQAGYEGWSALYLSSERGRTKRTGTLFDLMLAETGLPADRVLHIGDNPRGDLAMPRARGIECRPLPTAIETMKTAAPFLKAAADRILATQDPLGGRMLQHLATRHFDDPAANGGAFSQDARRFGYMFLGPLLSGFAAWLHDRAMADGVARLGFLTREGPVMRAVHAALFPDNPIATAEVIASRRIVRHAALTCDAGIEAALGRVGGSGHASAAGFLSVHFGLGPGRIDPAAIRDAGLGDRDAPIPAAYPASALRKLVWAHRAEIVAGAAVARAALTAHLRDAGLAAPGSAVVDIGYAGSMQSAFSGILGQPVGGYYMALFRTAADTLGPLPARAWLAEGVAATDRRHGICRHRHVYETLLCAPGPTFAGLARAGDGWHGIPAEGRDTPLRDAFTAEAHRGAVDFARDMQALLGAAPRFSAAAATAMIDAMLADPGPELAGWLGALEFEDAYDGFGPTTLVGLGGARPAWPEAAAALAPMPRRRPGPSSRPRWKPYGAYGLLGWRHLLPIVVAPIIARIGEPHDADHYREDPIAFFRRLSDPRYRRIGRWLYPWD